MNRYTVYLNRPAPDNKVVVYADSYSIETQPCGGSLLVLHRKHGANSAFTNWDAVVPDGPTEDSAPGPSQAWWDKLRQLEKADGGWDVQLFTDNPLESWPVVGGSYDGVEWVSHRGVVDSLRDHFSYFQDYVPLIDGTDFRFYRYTTMFPSRAHEILAERFPEEVGEKLQYPSRCIGGELSGAEGWSVLPDGYRAAFITYQDERVRVFVPEEFTDSDILKEILRLGLGV